MSDPAGDDRRDGPGRDDEPTSPQQRQAAAADLSQANETMDRVRREMPYRKALWGYRLYYIGVLSSMGSLLAGCFGEHNAAMAVIPIALPLGLVGYGYGYLRLRREFQAFMTAASSRVWHARRDRRNLWQSCVFKDAFMGRVR